MDDSHDSTLHLADWMEHDADSPEKSNKFLKQMTYLCLAQIFGHRHLVPSSAITKRRLSNGVPFMVFKRKDESGLKCYNLVKQVMESIGKKYLRSLMLIVGETTAALETYEIKLVYGDPDCITIRHDESLMSEIAYKGPETFQQEAAYVLRSLVCTLLSLAPLPPSVRLSLRMQYYERVPRDYMTFHDGKSRLEASRVKYANATQVTTVGRVDTCDSALVVKVQTSYMPDDFSRLYAANQKTYLSCEKQILERQKRRRENILPDQQNAHDAEQYDEGNASEVDERDVEHHSEAELLQEDYEPDLLAMETDGADTKKRKSALKRNQVDKDAQDQDGVENPWDDENSPRKNNDAITKRRRVSFQDAEGDLPEKENSTPKRGRSSAKNRTDRTIRGHGISSFKFPEDDDLSDAPPPPAHSTPKQKETHRRTPDASEVPKRLPKVPMKPQIKKTGKK
ncbi:essential protein for meiotic synapsis [Aphelenchoides avenae]|nr:essential protein for meiotic synapsis [Aphelenchus avenae]